MSAPLRIGMIDYLNTAPFRALAPTFPVDWVYAEPSGLTRAMADRTLDACMLPTAALIEANDVQPVGAYGIGAKGHVMSVLLFCRRPLPEIVRDEAPIFATEQSTTTRALLDQLCRSEFGRAPNLTSQRTRVDAALIIGDEAMDLALPERRWPIVRDMAQWWFEATGLPFVFARWVARADLDPMRKAALKAWLEATLEAAFTPIGRKELRRAGEAAGWSEDCADLYYQRLRFRFEEADLQGLEAFLAMLKTPGHACA